MLFRKKVVYSLHYLKISSMLPILDEQSTIGAPSGRDHSIDVDGDKEIALISMTIFMFIINA